jgi:hypothetical protein
MAAFLYNVLQSTVNNICTAITQTPLLVDNLGLIICYLGSTAESALEGDIVHARREEIIIADMVFLRSVGRVHRCNQISGA